MTHFAHIAGTIYLGPNPIPYAEACILRDVIVDEWQSARKCGDVDQIAATSVRENMLRRAIVAAADYRRAAGWSDPAMVSE